MPLLAGTRLGQYEIVSLVGAGGMGEVYQALDSKLKRVVAVKFLPDRLASPEGQRRFQLEAQAASLLAHPHIVTVHDVGELEGRQYLVTEYVDGGTLRDWLQSHRRSWREVAELLIGVADGLSAAHAAGILHRDIKPDNVLITKTGYGKLADFGLARLDERSASKDETHALTPAITQPGVLVGTVAYMSPEQVTGQHLDARSDVFSFGVLLYECFAGNRPFLGTSDVDVLHAILHGTPAPLGDEIPLALRAVVIKSLQKNPSDRYQTMQELVVELRRLLRDVSARNRETSQLWARAIAAVVVALIGVISWRLWQTAGDQRVRRIAVLPLENISGDANQEAFADGTTEAIILNLAQVHSLSVISHTSVMHFKKTTKTIPEIGRELHVDAFVTGTVQSAGGHVRVNAQLIDASTDRNLWANRFDRERTDVLQLEEDVAQAVAHEVQGHITPEELKRLSGARKVNPEAYDEYLLGRYLVWKNSGPESYQQAIQHLTRATRLDPDFGAAHAHGDGQDRPDVRFIANKSALPAGHCSAQNPGSDALN
jgi:serine/threonine protein kinase